MSQIDKVIAGRYALKSLIGQGGMADVYLAEDLILKRTVAVKIMRSSLTGDPVYVTRFHREASAAAALTHKNIVEIYDVGEDGDDYFIVMEYVPGQTLKELLHKRGALHFVEAVDIMKQVASATAKAHSIGIVHRDLKPQNIMVTDSGVVKIGDFGIASIQSLSQVTQTDTIMGSLHYLAPEIARGEKATPQSDIYALGIVFYELLRGDVPFNGESPVNIALKHMRDEIPSVREFNPSIPQSVENIIIRATAKNIKDRYQNADEMFDDLSECLSKEEDKVVFTYEEEESSATIVAEDKDFFTQKHTIEEVKEEKKIDKKKVGIIAGIVVGVIAIAVSVYFLFLKPVENFRMPSVEGMMLEQAITYLEDKGLKVDENYQYELSEQYDKDIVISTNPQKDTAVKKGDTITLTVSSGKYLIINNYVGKSYEDAEKELKELGFVVKKVEEKSEEDKDVILEQSIDAGEKMDPTEAEGKIITLTVSGGYSETMPNLYGQNISEAQRILSDLGFKPVLKVLPAPTDVDKIKTMEINIVMDQSVKAFTVVNKKGTEVILYYYDKKPELPTQTPDNPNPDPNNPSTDNPSTQPPTTDQPSQ